MIEATRLLGFAFAGADLLFEIDRDGAILFAMGATTGLVPGGELAGRQAESLFASSDGVHFIKTLRTIAPGDRVGPVPMNLAVGGIASLSICYLPQNANRISCTLVRPGNRAAVSAGTDVQTGLPDREAFLAEAVAHAGTDSALALVNLPTLPAICAKLLPDDAARLMTHIGETVRNIGISGGRISPTSFGVISEDPAAARHLGNSIRTVVASQGIDKLEVEEMLVSLKTRGLTHEQTLLAVRHVAAAFVENRMAETRPADLAEVFDHMVDETLQRAHAFNATVSDGAFDLVFEPIVALDTTTPSHFEALTRFQPGQSPAETIRFAEELGIAESFDLAVLLKVFHMIDAEPSSSAAIAVNISGRSIANANNFAMLAGLLMKKRALAHRVLIEVTESSGLSDVAAADRAIQAMRSMGYRVGIDDFGSGAASLEYLRGFAVDFLKVDGALVRRLGQSAREDALLKGVLKTCDDIGIDTVAEWVDTPDKLQRCREIGFLMGQGRYFGGALTTFPKARTFRPSRDRRLAG
jgi:EAL domain-containing protein (putative c-di-GMP-specific phosphodiesterase class I)